MALFLTLTCMIHFESISSGFHFICQWSCEARKWNHCVCLCMLWCFEAIKYCSLEDKPGLQPHSSSTSRSAPMKKPPLTISSPQISYAYITFFCKHYDYCLWRSYDYEQMTEFWGFVTFIKSALYLHNGILYQYNMSALWCPVPT